MAEIDGARLSATQKRLAVERGDTVHFPWGGNEKSLAMHATELMERSQARWKCWMVPNPERATDIDAFHEAYLGPQ